MERYNITFASGMKRLLLFAAGSLFLLAACQKNENEGMKASGPPSIERVRLTDPATADSNLTQATLGSTLVIVGSNLTGAQTVSFNGYVVDVNPVYAINNYLVITVPDSVPTVATDPNVPDELKVTTPLGEATYTFKILPPAPVVDHISNEYAKEGETITLYGKYFFFVDTVLFPEDIKVTSGFTTAADGSSLTVTIPAGIDAAAGDIRVKSQSGWSLAGRRTKLYDHSNTGMLLNWDDFNSNFGWGIDAGKAVIDNFPGITPLDGRYAVINMTVPGNWGWSNDKVIDLDNWGTGVIFPSEPANIYDPETPLANFDLKFEMANLQPVGELLLQVNHGGYQYNLPLNSVVKSADGKWYTVSVNLGDLADGSGGKMAKYKDLTASQTLQLVISDGTPAPIPVSMGIDNIRIVKVVQ